MIRSMYFRNEAEVMATKEFIKSLRTRNSEPLAPYQTPVFGQSVSSSLRERLANNPLVSGDK